MRQGLLNASNTKYKVNGAAHGSGIYLSPTAQLSFGYSEMRRLPAKPAKDQEQVIKFTLIESPCGSIVNSVIYVQFLSSR